MRTTVITIVVVLSALAAGADAQDASSVEQAREQARELNKVGAALVAKRDYAGALERFQQAYAAFPSPKILRNIAEVLKELGRAADAANVYQRYLDDPGSESSVRAEVTTILATLDATLGILVFATSPADVEITVDGWTPSWLAASVDPVWLPAAEAGRVRVPAGRFQARVRKPGFLAGEVAGEIGAGGKQNVDLRLVAEPVEDEPIVVAQPPKLDVPMHVVEAPPVRTARGLQLGALIDLAIDARGEGVAILPGIGLRLADRVQLDAKALIGGTPGAYLGASIHLTSGRLRPQLSAGVPVFFSDGARVGVRGGAGLSIELGARLSAVVEIGAEYFFDPEMDRRAFLVVPIIGARARL